MGSGFQILDIIVFAVIAGFLVLRLRNVLGRRTGNERPPPAAFGTRPGPEAKEAPADTVVRLPQRDGPRRPVETGPEPLAGALTQIKIADPSFDKEGFLKGARAAFEMIVDSFAKGDRETLRVLLSDEVYGNFTRAIGAREAKNESLEVTLVGVREANLIEAAMDGRVATLTVKFVSEQIKVTRDAKDQVVDGTPGRVATTTDIWTFARDTKNRRDPNWKLVATEAAN